MSDSDKVKITVSVTPQVKKFIKDFAKKQHRKVSPQCELWIEEKIEELKKGK